jgi:hypothetical protein
VDHVKATLKQRIIRLALVMSPAAVLAATFAGWRYP